MAAGLVLLTGVFFVLVGLARVGSLSSFISRPVLRGFSFGLALVIILKQLPRIAGVHPASSQVLVYAGELFGQLAHWNPWGVGAGAVALALLTLLEPLRRLPAALVVITLGIAADVAWPLRSVGIDVVGPIQLTLGWPTIPALGVRQWLDLAEVALALTLVLFAESYGSIRGFALKHGDPIRPDRDLLALGASNLVAGLFHGMPVGAGYSATSANEAAGARSRAAGGFAAVVVLLIVAVALRWVERTPEPVLAAIVIHAVAPSLNPRSFRSYFAWRRDRVVLISAVAAVIVLGVLDGLLAAIVISLLMMLRNLSGPTLSILGRLGEGHDFVDIKRHPEARPVDGIVIARPEAPLFFANAERSLAAAAHALPIAGSGGTPVHALIVSLEESPDIDGTTVEALGDFAAILERRGVRVLLARLKEPVRDLLLRAAIPQLPASCITGWSVDDAVVAALGAKPAAPGPAATSAA
jgi:MFS superfamily sulfate permease-like transporter